MGKRDLKVLFLTKKNNQYTEQAASFLKEQFPGAIIYFGTRHDPLPPEVLSWEGDLLISFISQWIIPAGLLSKAKTAAINFHPGPPEYPGIGCTNFAIYNNEKDYGVTCHHMSSKVDTGKLIAVKRFRIGEDDTVYSVTQKSYQLLLDLFYDLMNGILQGNELPVSKETWTRVPYTRKQLDELCFISPAMGEDEINRRIRATTYETPWAYTKIGKHVFRLQ